MFLITTLTALLIHDVVALPNGHVWGCQNISSKLPFCDATQPIETRLDDLISRLTLDENIDIHRCGRTILTVCALLTYAWYNFLFVDTFNSIIYINIVWS